MKKVLLISNMYPSKKYPHYGVFVENTEKILKNQKIYVIKSVIGKCDSKWQKILSYAGLYIKSVMLGVFGRFDAIYAHFISHTAVPLHVIRFFNSRIPIILNAHGNDIWPDTVEDVQNMKKTKKILPKVNGVIVPSNYYKSILINEYNFPEEKIKVFPSGGVNRNVFFKLEQGKAREYCHLKEDSFYVGYVSRIEKDKGWDIFLNAIKKLVDDLSIDKLRVLIVGDGVEKSEMMRLIEDNRLMDMIDYRPLVSQSELMYYYNALNIFCFPTQRKSESLGLVGLEAMACEVPCIISAMPGTLSYAEDRVNCLTFHPGDANDLKDKMIEMYQMKQDRLNALLENQRVTVSKFDSDTVKQSFILDFQELIRRN